MQKTLLTLVALFIVIITYTAAIIMTTAYVVMTHMPSEPGGETVVVILTPTPLPTLPVFKLTPTLAPSATPIPTPVPDGTSRRNTELDPNGEYDTPGFSLIGFFTECVTYQTLGAWEHLEEMEDNPRGWPCPADAIQRVPQYARYIDEFGVMPQHLLENCASAQVVGRHLDLYCPEDAIELAYPDGMPEQLLELCEMSREQDIDVKRFCP